MTAWETRGNTQYEFNLKGFTGWHRYLDGFRENGTWTEFNSWKGTVR